MVMGTAWADEDQVVNLARQGPDPEGDYSQPRDPYEQIDLRNTGRGDVSAQQADAYGNHWDGNQWVSPEGNTMGEDGVWYSPDKSLKYVGGTWVRVEAPAAGQRAAAALMDEPKTEGGLPSSQPFDLADTDLSKGDFGTYVPPEVIPKQTNEWGVAEPIVEPAAKGMTLQQLGQQAGYERQVADLQGQLERGEIDLPTAQQLAIQAQGPIETTSREMQQFDPFVQAQGGADGMQLINGQWVRSPETIRREAEVGQAGFGRIADLLTTDIPYAKGVQDVVGGIGAGVARVTDPFGIGSKVTQAAGIGSTEDIGRFIGKGFVPTNTAEAALFALPGVGVAPGVKSFARDVGEIGLNSAVKNVIGAGTGGAAREVLDELPGAFRAGTEVFTQLPASLGGGTTREFMGLRPRRLGVPAIAGAAPTPEEEIAFLSQKIAAEEATPATRTVAALRPIQDVISEVDTSTNPLVRGFQKVTQINPSVLENTDTGKALTGYMRQRVAADELTGVAVSAAFDTHAEKYTGRLGQLLPIDNEGLMTVSRNGVSGKAPWQDVFSRPGDFALTADQRSLIAGYRGVVDQVEEMRVAAGLRPLAKTGDEGWGYVPRQVKGIRGVEIRRPTNASLQRVYDDAVEGFANGIRYDRDPRATLELHVRSAYRAIADVQLSDAIEPLSVKPSALVPDGIRTRMTDAIESRRGAERLARRRVQETAVSSGKAPMPSTFTKKVSSDSAVQAAQSEFAAAKNAYSKAVQRAQNASVADASIFGGQAGNTIPIAQWRNRFLPLADANKLNESLGRFSRKGEVAWPGAVAKVVGTVANYTRFLSAVGDFSAPFIQGLPVLTQNPVVWARATARHYQAFFDPTVQARLVRDHLDTFQEMARYGVPIGDPEFFAAIREGGGFSAGKLLGPARGAGQKAGQQTFGRFQASYSTLLGYSRALMWEASKMDPPDKAQWIRNMTGGLDSRALGVSPGQREIESMFLAFSPRLLRSTVALVSDAVRPTTPAGRASLRSLAQLAAGATGVYVASGLALGKDWDEIERGLNPLNGKKFLSHEINGDWIGIGGQVRAITQLIAGIAADPGSTLSLNRLGNPILAFMNSRGAPALNLGYTLAEGLTGVDALPFDTIDSIPDMLLHMGTSALPFAIQGVLEGQNIETTLAALTGARTSAQTLGERVSALSAGAVKEAAKSGVLPAEISGLDYAQLTTKERTALLNQARESGNKDLIKALDDREKSLREKDSIFQQKRDEVAGYWDGKTEQLDSLTTSLFNGKVPAKNVESEVKRLSLIASGLYEDEDYRKAIESLPQNDIYRVMDEYRSIVDRVKKESGGAMTAQGWEIAEKAQTAYITDLASKDRDLANRLAYNLQDQQSPGSHKILQLYDEAEKMLTPYYDADEGDARTQYRKENPKVDYLLWLLGRTTTVRSEEAARLAQATTSGREIKLVR